MTSTVFTGTRILVAATNVEDARLVAELLGQDFDRVHTTTDPDLAVQDLAQYRPHVLVLAFKTLEESERCYLGLYRRSHQVEPHRTVVLCHRSCAYRAFELCRKQHFDDYVVFWPINYDPQRLRMAVLLASRAGATLGRAGPSTAEFAAQTHRIVELEALLQQNITRGNEHIAQFSESLREIEGGIGRSLDGFSRCMIDGDDPGLTGLAGRARFEQEFKRLRDVDISGHFQAVDAMLDPVRRWVDTFREDLAPQLEAIRALAELASKVRPALLVVDDDEFQHGLLRQQLQDVDIELLFASSGTEALAMLRTQSPDLILMDFGLPDVSGVEVMQRLKLVPATAEIPVILITGTSTKEVLQASYAAGAVDFMVKPIDRNRLLSGIRRNLQV